MRKWIISLSLALLAVLAASVGVQAATTTQQTLTFSVPAAVSISSGGDVAFGSIPPGTQGSKAGTLNLTSNDGNGFDVTAATPMATITESAPPGPCAASVTFASSNITVSGNPVAGGTGTQPGVGQSKPLGTVATSLWSTHPNVVGSAMTESVGYGVNVPGTQLPNSPNCSFVVPINFVMTGL